MAAPDSSSDPSTSSSSDPSILSDLGTIGKSALQFAGSPAGGQVIAGGLGMYEAGQASRQISGLYNPIQQTGGQFTQAGQQTLGKVQPALTASIPGQTGFATQQQGVAKTYGTGNLTPTQQQQVDAYTKQQKSMVMAELANAGITDPNSSQAQAKFQEIDNNAAYMAQNLVSGNQAIATGAQNAVQGVYNNILQQALYSAGFGADVQLAAARGIISGDTQISGSLQTLLKGISGIVTTAQPAAGQPGQPGGVAAGQAGGGQNVALGALKSAGGAISDIGAHMGIGGGSNPYSATVTPDLTMPAGSLVQPTATDTGAVTQVPASLDPYASDQSFSGFDLGMGSSDSVDVSQGA